jgi:hypothetical protein
VLWGIGSRAFPLEDWRKDRKSSLGSWLRVTAKFYTGERRQMLLPNTQVIASGVRLGEPPHLFLEDWDWTEFVLPQLAYHRVPLSVDVGTEMLVSIIAA